MKSSKGRLKVQFDFDLRQPICSNVEPFNNEIGYILRKNCSLQYKELRHVPEEVRALLRHKLLEKAQKNADLHGKRKWESKNSSKSTVRRHIGCRATLNSPTGHIETWRSRHWHAERGWLSPELEAKYEEMMKLRSENPPKNMTDKEILETVLG